MQDEQHRASPSVSKDTPAPSPTVSTIPVGYKTVERDGQTYEVTAHGTLERPVPGHPGWLEQRDSTGAGVITDAYGAPVAQLLPGDLVGMMDDMRITVHDTAGKAVNRSLDGDVPAELAPTPNQVAQLRIDQVAAMQPGFLPAKESPTNDTYHDINGSDLQSDQYSAAADSKASSTDTTTETTTEAAYAQLVEAFNPDNPLEISAL